MFIKHDEDVLSEAYTQHFFYGLAASNESAPRVPRVIDAFDSDDGYCLMVMERIEAPTLNASGISEDKAVEYAAIAVGWLLDQVSNVPDTVFGRISAFSDPVWHQFFKHQRAPEAFTDSSQLREYISEV